MAWTSAKKAMVAGAVILLAVGTTTVGVKEYRVHRFYAWELGPFPDRSYDQLTADARLGKSLGELQIVPSKYNKQMFYFGEGPGINYITADGTVTNNNEPWRIIGIGEPLDFIFEDAYTVDGLQPWPWRTIYRTEIPKRRGLYDYISTLSYGSKQPLQELIRKKFGIAARWELIETNVLAVRLSNPDLLRPAGSLLRSQNITHIDDQLTYNNGWMVKSVWAKNTGRGVIPIVSQTHFNSSIDNLIEQLSLERTFQIPVVNETGLTNRFDYTLNSPQPPDTLNAFKDALRKQLGLELVPARRAVEMLVVDRAK